MVVPMHMLTPQFEQLGAVMIEYINYYSKPLPFRFHIKGRIVWSPDKHKFDIIHFDSYESQFHITTNEIVRLEDHKDHLKLFLGNEVLRLTRI